MKHQRLNQNSPQQTMHINTAENKDQYKNYH